MPDIREVKENDTEVYRDDIDMYIRLWMEERNIQDMCKTSQNRWYNCCKYVCKNVFNNNNINPLKVEGCINNEYDKEKVNYILDLYIDLCNDYEKVINITGFTFLTGIHRDTLNGWMHDCEPGSLGFDISKKIDEMREESLVGLQVSGKGNPMNYMPSLNKYCGFNMPGVREQNQGKRKSIEQIQERYKALELSENGSQLELPDAEF